VFESAFVAKGYRDSVVRNAANKIGGAVQRINDPFGIGVATDMAARFFAENTVGRVGFF
jgi:hypothetical protein